GRRFLAAHHHLLYDAVGREKYVQVVSDDIGSREKQDGAGFDGVIVVVEYLLIMNFNDTLRCTKYIRDVLSGRSSDLNRLHIFLFEIVIIVAPEKRASLYQSGGSHSEQQRSSHNHGASFPSGRPTGHDASKRNRLRRRHTLMVSDRLAGTPFAPLDCLVPHTV